MGDNAQLVRIKYWRQQTLENGFWCHTSPMRRDLAIEMIESEIYEMPEIEPFHMSGDQAADAAILKATEEDNHV